MPSIELAPVSLTIPSPVGLAGAAVSMVTTWAWEATETLPLISVDRAVNDRLPAVRPVRATKALPEPSAMAEATTFPLRIASTLLPGSAVTSKENAVDLVM